MAMHTDSENNPRIYETWAGWGTAYAATINVFVLDIITVCACVCLCVSLGGINPAFVELKIYEYKITCLKFFY